MENRLLILLIISIKVFYIKCFIKGDGVIEFYYTKQDDNYNFICRSFVDATDKDRLAGLSMSFNQRIFYEVSEDDNFGKSFCSNS